VTVTRMVLLAGCLASLGLAAESRQDRGKRVIDEAVKALGGDNFLHMQNRIEFGRAYSFYREQINGLSIAKVYTRYLPAVPGEMRLEERDSFGKVDARSAELKESSAQLFKTDGAYEITFRGVRPLEDLRFANYKDSMLRNIFYILRQRLNEPGLTFYAQDPDFYEHRPVDIVDITDAANQTVTVYFDQTTKLPVKQVFRRRNPEYKDFDTETSIFAKYRDIDGIKWPQTVLRERNGEKVFEMYSDSVQMNKNLGENLFALPTGAKMLPKAK